MSKLSNLLHKDILLGIKDVFLVLEVVFAIIFMLVILFILPKEIRTEGKVYIWDKTSIVEDFVKEHIPNVEQQEGEYYVTSRAGVIEGMTTDKSSVGLIIDYGPDNNYTIELLLQPYTKSGLIDYIDVDLEDLLTIIEPPYGRYPVDVYSSVRLEAIKRGESDVLPFNKRVLPTFLLFNVGFIGLFAMVSLIGQERVDMTIRAYRVTPSSLGKFLLSKYLVLLIVSTVTFSILYLPIMGFTGFLYSLIIILLTVVVMSSFGIMLASYYSTPLEAMGWVFVIMLILGLPVVSMMNPVFSPFVLRLIPSSHSLYGLDAAMFPDNNQSLIYLEIIILSAMALIIVPLSTLFFVRKIRKEA